MPILSAYNEFTYTIASNPSTVIEFSLPMAGEISLKVYSILGTEITQLAGGNYSPGNSGSFLFLGLLI